MRKRGRKMINQGSTNAVMKAPNKSRTAPSGEGICILTILFYFYETFQGCEVIFSLHQRPTSHWWHFELCLENSSFLRFPNPKFASNATAVGHRSGPELSRPSFICGLQMPLRLHALLSRSTAFKRSLVSGGIESERAGRNKGKTEGEREIKKKQRRSREMMKKKRQEVKAG